MATEDPATRPVTEADLMALGELATQMHRKGRAVIERYDGDDFARLAWSLRRLLNAHPG